MWIKLILIAGILFAGVMMLRTGGSDRNAALRRLGMAAFTVLAIILVIYPSLTTRMANLVGVKRGADLVFYLLVLAFLGSLITAAQRNAATERKITRIARNLALQQVRYPSPEVQARIAQLNAAACTTADCETVSKVDSREADAAASSEHSENAAKETGDADSDAEGDCALLASSHSPSSSEVAASHSLSADNSAAENAAAPAATSPSIAAASKQEKTTELAATELAELPTAESEHPGTAPIEAQTSVTETVVLDADSVPAADALADDQLTGEVGVVPAAVNSALSNVAAAISAATANTNPAARFRALAELEIDPTTAQEADLNAVTAIPQEERDATMQRLLATVARSRAFLAGQEADELAQKPQES